MVVGFTTTYAISAYHDCYCEFESRIGQGVQHYVIKLVCDLRQICCFHRVLWFPPPIKLTPTNNNHSLTPIIKDGIIISFFHSQDPLCNIILNGTYALHARYVLFMGNDNKQRSYIFISGIILNLE